MSILFSLNFIDLSVHPSSRICFHVHPCKNVGED